MKPIVPVVPRHLRPIERRHFISNVTKASMATALALAAGRAHAGSLFWTQKQYTVGDIMDIVIKDIPGAPFAQTVDTLKSGSRDKLVTGIATTMFATIDIIHKVIKAGANLIIAHEPTFYNHTDDIKWVSPNDIVRQKQELLQKNNITLWRLHDYLHSFVPDSVQYGVVQNAGWLSYYKPGSPMLTMPPVSLEALAGHLKKTLNIEHVRIIGRLLQSCERIALLPGAAGGQRHISLVEKEKPDVLIVGEVHEWETAEYIRDLQQLGGKTSLIVLGHSVSEEPGLEWLQQWLQPRVTGLKVQHLVSGNPFTWV